MATTTPNYGWPIPQSTDLVKDGATAIASLGTAIDSTVYNLPGAAIVQVKYDELATAVSNTGSTAFKVAGLSVAITPSSTANYIVVDVRGDLSDNNNYVSQAFLYEAVGGGSDTLVGRIYEVFAGSSVSNNRGAVATRQFKIQPTTLDERVYSVYCSPYFTSFTVTWGGGATGDSGSSMMAMEVVP
jgi:hypothetical protein